MIVQETDKKKKKNKNVKPCLSSGVDREWLGTVTLKSCNTMINGSLSLMYKSVPMDCGLCLNMDSWDKARKIIGVPTCLVCPSLQNILSPGMNDLEFNWHENLFLPSIFICSCT